jgi:hypothetical protein
MDGGMEARGEMRGDEADRPAASRRRSLGSNWGLDGAQAAAVVFGDFEKASWRRNERSVPGCRADLCSTLLFWVNWIHAIIIFIFRKCVITIQLTMSVSLQFCTCLKNAIMYARSRMWPTCRRIRGGHIFVWT